MQHHHNPILSRPNTASMTASHTVFRIASVAVVACLVFLSLSCASVTVRKLTKQPSDNVTGIRFYRPMPYLVVSEVPPEKPDKPAAEKSVSPDKGTPAEPRLSFSIIWMPDRSEEYVIDAKSGLGSVEFNPKLENGWNLTGLEAKADSKASELLTAVAALVTASRGSFQGKQIKPGMYRFIFETKPGDNYGQIVEVDWSHPIF